ncbi:malonate-semialdehyde dehydrogenase (acetylating)/methylmalonate-semialdehyde dehydrogenase [Desulfitispora alkaliphila]|uniref:aldehyde dehydrogenase family protein n=1 Tax=Desulfitispora alkaliphila TaxID=622674 RepID=UPI003D1FEEF7
MEFIRFKDYINGEWVEEKGVDHLRVYNPSTGKEIGEVPITPTEQVEKAIFAAEEAFKSWRKVSMGKRMEYLFKLHSELNSRHEELAQVIAEDQAKHINDARGEVSRAIQLTETACGIPLMMRGDKIAISEEIDGEILREPLGVVGALAPFNFPALVFGWFVPFAIGTGNTMVFKASELSPVFMQKIVEILETIELPRGVFNLVNGNKSVAETMLKSPLISAMAFVGSTPVGKIVAEESAKTGKRSMVLAGAKNTLLVAEDANIDGFIENFINSCYGAAGQRCMAGANVAIVEEVYDKVKERIIEASKNIKYGDAKDEKVFMGPVISKEAVERIHQYIDLGVKEGANLVLDGREPELSEANRNGYFVAPTILSEVTSEMTVAKEEIFGPVVTVIKVSCINEGIEFMNSSEYGNGGSIFTESGLYAQKFLREAESGMLGVNVGVPASMPYLPFGGAKASLLGSQIKAQGQDAVDFFTKRKAATIRYYGKEHDGNGVTSSCTTLK